MTCIASSKIRAAVDGEPMSAIAERAIGFYLNHSDVVDGVHGTAHLVYECPCLHNVSGD